MLRQFLVQFKARHCNTSNITLAFTFALLMSASTVSMPAHADSSGQNFRIKIKQLETSFSPSQARALSRFIEDVKTALPQKLKDSFEKPIQIEFKKLNDAGFGPPPCSAQASSPNYRYGLEPVILPWQSEHQVEMNEGFLPEIFKARMP